MYSTAQTTDLGIWSFSFIRLAFVLREGDLGLGSVQIVGVGFQGRLKKKKKIRMAKIKVKLHNEYPNRPRGGFHIP